MSVRKRGVQSRASGSRDFRTAYRRLEQKARSRVTAERSSQYADAIHYRKSSSDSSVHLSKQHRATLLREEQEFSPEKPKASVTRRSATPIKRCATAPFLWLDRTVKTLLANVRQLLYRTKRGGYRRFIQKNFFPALGGLLLAVAAAPFMFMDAQAATAVLVPNSDVTSQWPVVQGGGGTHYGAVDEGITPDTNSYIGTGTGDQNGAGIQRFGMTTASNIDEATSITLNMHAQNFANTNNGRDDIVMRIHINDSVVATDTVTPPDGGAWTWYDLNITGNWNQSDIDSLEVSFEQIVQGGGPGANRQDNLRISTVHVDLEYSVSMLTEQSSYRWLENEDYMESAPWIEADSVMTSNNIRTDYLLESDNNDLYWSFGSFDGTVYLYRSTDGGSTWAEIESVSVGGTSSINTVYMLEAAGNLYWAFGTGWSNNTAYLYRSIDDGASWSEIESVTVTNGVNTTYLLESNPGDLYWSFGSSDNTAYLYHGSSDGSTWNEAESITTGNNVWIDHLLESSSGDLYWSFGSIDSTAYLYQSTDGGSIWIEVESVTTGGSIRTNHLLEAADGNLFWSFGSQDNTAYLYQSIDDGANWTEAESIATGSNVRTDHLLESSSGDIFWSFGSEDNTAYLYQSIDDGANWTEAESVATGNPVWTDHLLESSSGGLYWSFGSDNNTAYLYHSSDDGLTWTEAESVATGSNVRTDHLLESSSGGLYWSFGSNDNFAYLYKSLIFAQIGNSMTDQNAPVSALPEGEPFRLRATVSADQGDLPAGAGSFKFQYAELGPDAVCTADFSGGEEYTDVAARIATQDYTGDSDWNARRGNAAVVHDDKMWILGGITASPLTPPEVAYTEDGESWTVTASSSPWQQREHMDAASFDGAMWVVGGYFQGMNMSDVWRSENGSSWTEVTDNPAWGERSGHTLLTFDDKLWLLGGFDGFTQTNEVWHTEDGESWTQATSSAAWDARDHHSSVVHDGKMWVIGGRDDSSSRLNDVWYSEDGVNWLEATSDAEWNERYLHSSVMYEDRLWVIGGDISGGDGVDDAWSSADGVTWAQEIKEAAWGERLNHASVTYKDAIWVLGGTTTGDGGSSNTDSVWSAFRPSIGFYNNQNIPDGFGIAPSPDDPDPGSGSAVHQIYVESNNFTNPNTIPDGDYGIWDFALVDNDAPAEATYCFRIVDSDGSELSTYTVIPELHIPPPAFTQADYRWYEDKELESEHWPLIETLQESSEEISFIKFSPDGELIAYASDDNNVYIHSASNWSRVTTLNEATSTIRGVVFSPDGQFFSYIDGFMDGSTPNYNAYIHSTDDWGLVETISISNRRIQAIDFSPDENYVALGTGTSAGDGSIYVYLTSNWSQEEVITSPSSTVLSLSFSPDSSQIVYSIDFFGVGVGLINTSDWSSDGSISIAGSGALNDITYSPDGAYVAYGRADNNVYVHSTDDWSLTETLSEATGNVRSVNFSSDGKLLAYASNDGVVYVHSTDDWSLTETLSEATGNVRSVNFSSDDEYLAYGGADNNVYVHSTESLIAEVGAPLADQNEPFTLDGPNQAVRLRMLMDVDDKDATQGDFKLQYAPRIGDTCSVDFIGYDYRDIFGGGNGNESPDTGAMSGSIAESIENPGANTGIWWEDAENALNEPDFSYIILMTSQDSEYLVVRDFGLSIPENAEIVGIEAGYDVNIGAGATPHYGLYVDNDFISSVGVDSDMDGSYEVRGGSTSLWGQAWNPADINSPDFGLALHVVEDGGSGSVSEVNHMRVKIYYELPEDDDIHITFNSSPPHGISIVSSPDDPSNSRDTVNQVVVSSNNFSIVNATPRGATAMFDFSIYDNSDSGGNYCFRVVKADGSLLDNYAFIPELGTPPRQQQFMRHGRWFDTAEQARPFFW